MQCSIYIHKIKLISYVKFFYMLAVFFSSVLSVTEKSMLKSLLYGGFVNFSCSSVIVALNILVLLFAYRFRIVESSW